MVTLGLGARLATSSVILCHDLVGVRRLNSGKTASRSAVA